MNEAKILIGMTGSVGMLSMPTYLQHFKMYFSHIKIIMTDAAQQFISKESIALVNPSVYCNLFPLNSSKEGHVQLARWADIFIILPATANIIAEIAYGMSRSLLSLTALCYQKSIVFFPNMNPLMFNNPATKRNISLLKELGHKIVAPTKQVGFEYATATFKEEDFMPSPEDVIEIVQKLEQEMEKFMMSENGI